MLRLEVTRVTIPLLAPFTTSFGTEVARSGMILTLTGRGVTAYGECVASENPYYGPEDNETALHMVRDHLAGLIWDGPSPKEFLSRAQRVRGNNMAKAAVEMLLWDFHAKLKGRPLQKELGESKGYADVGISIGIDSPEQMARSAGRALENGYKRIKVKVEKGKELAIVRAIRESYPSAPLSVDANSCYSYRDAGLLERLDRYGLEYIEQPLGHDDLLDHAKLRKRISTPICLDESVSTVEKAQQAFELGAVDVINIKPGRVGGLANSLEIARTARKNGGHVWVGGMLETGVGRSFNIALASSRLIDYPGDTSPNDRYFRRDIVKNPFRMSEGRIKPNRGPGIGVVVDEEYFAEATVRRPVVVEPGRKRFTA